MIVDTRVMTAWITATPATSLALGASRIGGVPDLPRDTPWPRHHWTHEATTAWPDWARAELRGAVATVIEDATGIVFVPFVVQLDLAALPPQDLLPRKGHLWLFADQRTTLGAIEHYTYHACTCLYAEHADLVPASPPPTPDVLPAFSLTFSIGDGEQAAPRHAVLPRVPDDGADDYPAGYTAILRIDSDGLLNWGDGAWITFALPQEALEARAWSEIRAFRFAG